jgi:flagellar basal-body rod modification protein FlgD
MTTSGISAAGNTPEAPGAPKRPDQLSADKDTFLKLLVAQLKHQNPLEPADGLQFVTQLAQFTAIEHSAAMRDDLAAIRTALDLQAAQNSAAPTNS